MKIWHHLIIIIIIIIIMVEARRPDNVFVDKEAMEAKIIVIAIPGTAREKDKEVKKIEKYQLLREEIRKLWRVWKVKKVTVEPVVVGALGDLSYMFDKHMETTIRLEVIQKTALLGTARILRNVSSIYGIRRGFPWDL